jgi:hypothetical protein
MMGDAVRVLDDISDTLGVVLRRADELLADWSRFGAEVRVQVDREAASIAGVVDSAVTRAAGAGLDRAIADRLRALTAELERLEQRTRAVSRATMKQRQGDRRILWVVVAGVVVANALLVALLVRRPEAAPAIEPVRIDSVTPAGEATGVRAPSPGSATPASGSGASPGAPAPAAPDALSPGPRTESRATGSSAGHGAGAATGSATQGPAAPLAGGVRGGGGDVAGATHGSGVLAGATPPPGVAVPDPGSDKPAVAPLGTPLRPGAPRPHKKLR